MQSDPAGQSVEVYRSRRLSACDERAFVLHAVGIGSAIARDTGGYALLVEEGAALAALEHLRRYEIERAAQRRPPPPPQQLHPNAWAGSLVFALIVVGVAFIVANGLWRLDAFDVGDLDAGRVRAGQWWRVWTALTLHLDGPHLAANTVAGVWFGYLAARLLGTGRAWLLIVLGAGLANGIEAVIAPASHRAVGASTAVFTALGLLSGYSWATRQAYSQRWALRWGPLVAGLVLLAWTGTGGKSLDDPTSDVGQSVDVAAHVLGFAVGLLSGASVSLARVGSVLNRMPQPLAGLLALAVIVVSWARALGS
jgi:rhomboid protease GluP